MFEEGSKSRVFKELELPVGKVWKKHFLLNKSSKKLCLKLFHFNLNKENLSTLRAKKQLF